MALRAKNAVVLAKIESVTGTDAVPVAATDAVLVENPQVDPQVGVIETNEVTGSLDGAGPIVGGIKGRITFDVLLKGAGAAATAPEFGKLLRACGWAETTTAADLPASPEACAAGGTSSVANLGTSAGTTPQAYRGMPVEFTGTVAGLAFIADYTAAKAATLTDVMSGAIAATTSYQLLRNVLYAPGSTAIPSLTLYVHLDGILYKFTGCRGSFSIAIEAGGIGRISFEFMGHFLSKTDAAVPAAPVYDATRPPLWRGGRMLINRGAAAVSRFGLDNGASLVMPGDPNRAEGFDYPIHTRRAMRGSMDPLEELVGTRDIMGDFRAGTRRILHARFGTAPGNRIGITVPQGHYTGQSPSNRDDLLGVQVPFACVGRDAGAFVCFY